MKRKYQNSTNALRHVSVFLLLLCYTVSYAEINPKERNILADKAKSIDLGRFLVTDNSWNKYPDYKNRQFWTNIPANIRQDYISKAEGYLDYNWPVVKATDYLEFIRSGNRRQGAYAAPSRALNSLVMGELIEGKGRFIDQIINAVWYYSEQTWWGWSAHLYFQKAPGGLPDVNEPTVDLGVGEIANDLAWTWYLFKDEFDKIHPLISTRLKQEIMNKAVKPYAERTDFGYMGFKGGRPNNWNPWINYNMLNCFLLLEDDPAKKLADVIKIINSLDKFLNGYSDDGGCDEGPSYWGAAGALLYESLAILKDATGGKFDVFDNSLVKNIGKYFYKVNIHAPYFLNFADADATTGGDSYTVYQYGKAIGDERMKQFGAYLAILNKWGQHSMSGKICDQIKELGSLDEIKNADAKEALVADFWLPQTEVAGGRDKADSYMGFFFGAKGGFNNESHNHNDVGSCVLYFDGKPCLIDLGREEYTARTFSSRRYEIWTMQSGYHTLPVINGTEQSPGASFKARNTKFSANERSISFLAEIADAYPSAAKVKTWIRSYLLVRGKSFTISDKFELLEKTGAKTSSNLITYCKVSEVSEGLLKFEGEGFVMNMKYNPKVVKPVIEFKEVTDNSLRRYWPKGVTRVILEFVSPSLSGAQDIIFTAQPATGWTASKETVEKLSKSRSEFNYYEDKVPSFKLPSVLTANNGKLVGTKDEWMKIRRPELLELFRTNVYGRVPATPYQMDFKIINEDDKAIGGAAKLKQIDVIIKAGGKSLTIHLNLFIPNNVKKPVPVFLLICNRGLDNIDPTRQVKAEFWPVEEVIERGYGIAAFYNADVDPDVDDNFKDGIHALLDNGIRPPDAWGTIAAWAWGASRCLDYLITDKDVSNNKVALIGHSRGGKTALWAGAEDQRFAMIIGNESGCGGSSISRRRFGETVARINTAFPHWFCSNYKKYNDNENALPIDQHMLLALTAPRVLYIDCAADDLWGDPMGSYLALCSSIPVFKLFDGKTSISETMPPLNTQVTSGKVAFHIRDGEHNLKLKDWNFIMDFADKVLK
jgi:hypothetical protein